MIKIFIKLKDLAFVYLKRYSIWIFFSTHLTLTEILVQVEFESSATQPKHLGGLGEQT